MSILEDLTIGLPVELDTSVQGKPMLVERKTNTVWIVSRYVNGTPSRSSRITHDAESADRWRVEPANASVDPAEDEDTKSPEAALEYARLIVVNAR